MSTCQSDYANAMRLNQLSTDKHLILMSPKIDMQLFDRGPMSIQRDARQRLGAPMACIYIAFLTTERCTDTKKNAVYYSNTE